MRAAFGIPLAALALALAGPALAQSAPPAVTGPPPPSCDNGCGGSGNVLPPNYSRWAEAETQTPQRVYAVVGEHLVTGFTKPDRLGGGELTLVDERDPSFACAGVYGPAKDGGLSVSLACSHGIRLRLWAHPTLDAAGLARSPAQPASAVLSYGYTAKRAAKRLAPPPGFELVAEGRSLRLEPAGL